MATDIPGIDSTIDSVTTLDNENAKFAKNSNDKVVVRVEDEDGNTILASILAALSPDGLVWNRFGPLNIPASSTVVVDTNLLSSFSRIDYILNFKDSPVTVTRSFKLIAQNNAGAVTDSVSERLGGPINVQVNFTDDGIDGFLEVTNNESFDLTLNYLRAVTP